ncbi:GNAT family N-acetyltransferase [Rugamonas sp. DEMB1]|uniref:GNAT family N-acetyltransferase n=1 Tax=Rugamonas sp. DEMB1 TaxID=3039386 RepID=UPI0028BDAA5C|nr:GNAT family N-acetyltransferase [Rugamonas sp. DEMB1]
MSPSATFRQATVADIPAMSRIRLEVRENTLADPARITQQMYLDYLERLGRGWVAEVHGEIAGFCYAASQDASIWALFIAPEHEGRGCAKRLLALAVDWLFELGNDEVRLSTAANTRADRFYAAQGWSRGAQTGATDVQYRVRKAPSKPSQPPGANSR